MVCHPVDPRALHGFQPNSRYADLFCQIFQVTSPAEAVKEETLVEETLLKESLLKEEPPVKEEPLMKEKLLEPPVKEEPLMNEEPLVKEESMATAEAETACDAKPELEDGEIEDEEMEELGAVESGYGTRRKRKRTTRPTKKERKANALLEEGKQLHQLLQKSEDRLMKKSHLEGRQAHQGVKQAHQGGRKLFVGGLHPATTSEVLRAYFSSLQAVHQAIVKRHAATQHSRCFGFVTFTSVAAAEAVFQVRPHIIEGNVVELRRVEQRVQGGARPKHLPLETPKFDHLPLQKPGIGHLPLQKPGASHLPLPKPAPEHPSAKRPAEENLQQPSKKPIQQHQAAQEPCTGRPAPATELLAPQKSGTEHLHLEKPAPKCPSSQKLVTVIPDIQKPGTKPPNIHTAVPGPPILKKPSTEPPNIQKLSPGAPIHKKPSICPPNLQKPAPGPPILKKPVTAPLDLHKPAPRNPPAEKTLTVTLPPKMSIRPQKQAELPPRAQGSQHLPLKKRLWARQLPSPALPPSLPPALPPSLPPALPLAAQFTMRRGGGRHAWLRRLLGFLERRGTPLAACPALPDLAEQFALQQAAPRPLDLHLLYTAVKAEGGGAACTANQGWGKVAASLLGVQLVPPQHCLHLRCLYDRTLLAFEENEVREMQESVMQGMQLGVVGTSSPSHMGTSSPSHLGGSPSNKPQGMPPSSPSASFRPSVLERLGSHIPHQGRHKNRKIY